MTGPLLTRLGETDQTSAVAGWRAEVRLGEWKMPAAATLTRVRVVSCLDEFYWSAGSKFRLGVPVHGSAAAGFMTLPRGLGPHALRTGRLQLRSLSRSRFGGHFSPRRRRAPPSIPGGIALALDRAG
jgi:hypothetical protein